ncbi:hypothetical protein JOE11_005562 [Robbsia andropogonis]|uniref:hypothetical protein n=1 Tax=Robbsia andropogonis TaxID=28092 RepID=UPI003D1EEE8E
MCSDDNNPTDDDLAVLVCERGDDAMFSSAKEEIVQCEVLHYGNVSAFTAWVSTAMRVDNLGKIIGATHGQEYRGDVAELAHK